MPKAFVISIPSLSVHNTLSQVVECLSAEGVEIIYYNAIDFLLKEKNGVRSIAYPDYKIGYSADAVDGNTSFFKFAEILVDTSEAIIDFILTEAEREAPDFILHSHLALWGNLLSEARGIRAVSLYTTFVLDEKFMLPYLREVNQSSSFEFSQLMPALNFHRKLDKIHKRIGVRKMPNIWEAYVNRAPLNIAFIPEIFQPHRKLFDDRFVFVGFPSQRTQTEAPRTKIYVSMGTVFNKDIEFFELCIDVFSCIGHTVIISAGNASSQLHDIAPSNIVIKDWVDQKRTLEESVLFLTHGGMASTMEAINTSTPMVVIPQIPEQMLTAGIVESLNIGLNIPKSNLTKESLTIAVLRILQNKKSFQQAFKSLHATLGNSLPIPDAVRRIKNYAGTKHEISAGSR